MNFAERLEEYTQTHDDTDICVYCGEPGCDKVALPDLSYFDHPECNFSPGDMCHSECERELMRERSEGSKGKLFLPRKEDIERG